MKFLSSIIFYAFFYIFFYIFFIFLSKTKIQRYPLYKAENRLSKSNETDN